MPSKTILLFDVDGTLTPPRKKETDDMKQALKKVHAAGYTLGVVGGSDFAKQKEQLGESILDDFDYVFSENGLLSFHKGKEFHRNSLLKFLGNDKVMAFVKRCLVLIAALDIPVQRGTFVEFRNGMFNISPIGRNCLQEERDDFEQYDKQHHIREKLIEDLKATFPDYPLAYSIGGQISFDVFPKGWDKTYCLQFVEKEYEHIHFFGDKTSAGGNDYEIFNDSRTIGHSVKTYKDTIEILHKMAAEKP
ncbi:phosphomannomutase putative (PMM) [Leptomonas pyrrhocoris]|uniref:Phosphomannomutase n=1 Tax=Leptomonas pyrrhocoris TaxID=157538 RepID=A0A0M9G199_LEPPY|nr:phosphomannomutase putative (PMM) [Leptomonas pyrrhocoris]XP_015658578.1 phosphomannomutase putative (PMM) [Leptomonas pyrrhocoris]KPA80138.1 phosphomannomutase putative (PMM) [Leptomonas pyrrhocoris]KPA80139.1 phosphomannomutase putative (PMM) [Leptomonas pyrrhocoris]|eukprot:XP_015658577.1 phosphomannomutase putative (PMM) [Leptomonas pyrrhocoris]